MTQYATQAHQCRMQLILEYFDEHSFDSCGKCDVCIEKKKKDNVVSFKDYEGQVSELLSHKPMTVDELESALSPRDRHLFIEVVRELVDQGTIKYDEYWVLRRV